MNSNEAFCFSFELPCPKYGQYNHLNEKQCMVQIMSSHQSKSYV